MTNEQFLPDLTLSGIGKAMGGRYGNVRTDGVCTVLSDVKSDSFETNGILKVAGSLTTNRFVCNGKMDVNGTVSAGDARIDGYLKVNGSVSGEQVNLNGMLKADGDVEAEQLRAMGWFEVNGLLNAGSLEIRLQGKSVARELGGERIRVIKGPSSTWNELLKWAVPKLNIHLEADVIEGDEIELEETTANVVRGNRIKIGKGCKIGRVEYREELKIHPQARVKDQVKE